MKNILFVCTGNSARSIMAECLMNHLGQGKFEAWSSGSHPTGTPNPHALTTLRQNKVPLIAGGGLEPWSKSWDVFASERAPMLDIVVTVCDNAAGEVCPVWHTAPGKKQPEKLHWGFPDPADPDIPEQEKPEAFQRIFEQIEKRIGEFLQEASP